LASSYKQAFIHGESYEKWIKKTRLHIETGRELKTLARKKTPAAGIAKRLKRTEGATRQKAFSLGLSPDSRA
jgi:hypothetical protein